MRTSNLAMNGKTDDDLIIRTIRTLRDVWHVPYHLIKKDYFILIKTADNTIEGPFRYLSEFKPGYFMHCPDITILDSDGKIKLLIELDGTIHHKTKTKTYKRNTHYEDAKIRYLAIPVSAKRNFDREIRPILDQTLGELL